MRKIDDLVIKLLEYDLRPTPQGGWRNADLSGVRNGTGT